MPAERSAPPQGPPIPGARPKRFLGAGGFADVFLYEQQVPRRDVAVKILRQGGSQRDHHRFTTEADLMARLSSHPSIVSVYGAGTVEEERSYLIMEYCPPPHLGKLAASQPLTLTRALEIGIQVAGAVETIHRVGYLHRDIKPANILVTPFGRPVLGDFGIAAPIGLSVEQDEFGGASPPWASPEQQLDQESLTPASDVYALAATIYTLLAGRSPHVDVSGADRNDQLSMLDRVLHRPIPPIGRRDVPEQLERVLVTAMAKSPRGRYASAVALARALQQVQTDLQLAATQLDVMEEAPGGDTGGGRDQDSTMLRPVVTVDPDGPTGTVPAAHRHDDAATTFAPRRVEAQPTGSASPRNRPRPRFSVPQAPAGPRMPEELGTRPGRTDDEADPAVEAEVPPGHRASPSSVSTSSSPHPVSSPPCQDDAPQGAAETADAQEAEAGLSRQRRRLSGRAVAVTVLGAAVVICLTGIGVWSALRGEGGTQQATAQPATTAPPGAFPGAGVLPAVTNLKVSQAEGLVTATWSYDSSGDDVVFLYRISDPGQLLPVQETRQTGATVTPVSARTCIEVVARDSSGAASEAAVACVDTPGAGSEG